MNPRTTGILFLVALALGAFVYFYEIGGEEARREAEAREKQLFPELSADDVAWIALTTSDGREARFERQGGAWRLVEPLDFPADAAVGRMAEALASVKSEAVFRDPQPPAEYGLDDASARIVRFGTGTGDAAREREVRFGDATPVGARTYAATSGSDAVYTVEGFRAKAFEKTLTDLRDKQIAEFDRAAIREVEVRWPGAQVVVRRNDEGEGEGEWRMTAPLDARADDEAVKGLLSSLSFLRAEGFVDAPTEAQRALLDPPAVEVALVPGAVEEAETAAPVVLALSRADADGRRLVRAGGDTLYEIAGERIADVPREVVAYRHRTLAQFALSEARQVDFFFQPAVGDPVAITAERTDAGWVSEPEDFAPGKLPRLVSELSRLVAESILAESLGEDELEEVGLSPPTTIISVFGERPEAGEDEDAEDATAPKLAEVHLGRVTDAGVVARPAGASTVYRLSRALTEHIPADLAAFRSRFRAEAEPSEPEEPPHPVPGPAVDLPSPREESP